MDRLKRGIMLEDKPEDTGKLICDRTGESWTVGYTITHSTEVVISRGIRRSRICDRPELE
jgi:hypothetical protein